MNKSHIEHNPEQVIDVEWDTVVQAYVLHHNGQSICLGSTEYHDAVAEAAAILHNPSYSQ